MSMAASTRIDAIILVSSKGARERSNMIDELVPARFDHAGLTVANLSAMERWYVRAFDLTVQHRFHLAELDLSIVMLVDGRGVRFELLHRSQGSPGLRAPDPAAAATVRGLGHVCFAVPDLQAAYTQLLDGGAPAVIEPRESPESGVWMAWVHDPEGNLIEVIGPPVVD